MSRGIKLSPKHGLNPSMDMCFWCGEPKGILLMGRIHEKKGDHTDVEAPKGMVTSLEPCDKCKENFKLGIRIIEVVDDGSRFENNVRFAIKAEDGKLMWPTGRFVVMNADAIKGGEAGQVRLCTTDVMDKILERHDSQKAKDSGGECAEEEK